jgi:CheY-like chemotaxis protein
MLRRYVEGYEFVMAHTLDRAKDWLQRIYPIAILADSMWLNRAMNEADNLATLSTAPVVHAPLPGTRRTGVLLGAVDYLAKPVTREMLAQALERLGAPYEKVLIIDDDPHVVRLMGRMIKAEDPEVQVLEAFDGSTGLEIAREQRPNVILLDLLMPGMSGYDVLRAIADDPTLTSTSVIIVSARGLDDEGAPVSGEIRLLRARGFSATEMLQVIGSTLNGISAMTR